MERPAQRESSAAATLDPMALAPDPTVVAIASRTAITATAWTITATADGNGSITPSGAVSVPADSDRTFTMTPAACAVLSNVQVDGIDQGPLTTYTFQHVLSTHTIAATFVAARPDTIIASAGPGGSITPQGALVLECGSTQTYTITPDTCSLVGDVFVDGVSQGAVVSFTFHDIRAPHTIVAKFVPGRKLPSQSQRGTRWKHQPRGVGAGGLRERPELRDHGELMLSNRRRRRGWGVARPTDQLHVCRRSRRAQHRCELRGQLHRTHDHLQRDPRSNHRPGGASDVVKLRRESDLHDHTRPVFPDHRCGRGWGLTGRAQELHEGHQRLPFDHRELRARSAIHDHGRRGCRWKHNPSGLVAVDCGSSQEFTITPGVCSQGFDVVVDGVSQGPVLSYTFTDVNDPHTIFATFFHHSTIGVGRAACPDGRVRPVPRGGPLAPNHTFTVDLQDIECVSPPPGSVLDSVGTVQTDGAGFIVSSNLPCLLPLVYTLIIDVSGNRIFDPECDALACFSSINPAPINGIQGLEATNAPEGPALSWWVTDLSEYRGFRVYRAGDGEDETLVTPSALVPPDTHPPVKMRWRDATVAPGGRFAYRLEALKAVGSDWYGPVTLSVPGVPQEFAFHGVTPNPFRGSTQIMLDMPSGVGAIRLDVFDVAGRRVRELIHGPVLPGQAIVDWNGLNDKGEPLRAGLYMVRLQSALGTRTTHVVKME